MGPVDGANGAVTKAQTLLEMYGEVQPLLFRLRPLLAQAAQQVYDEWEQDEEGLSDWYGGGGICDAIAEAWYGVINSKTSFNVMGGGQDGDDHNWIIVYNESEAFGVDIPPQVYETGGGYSWKKIPGVVFRPEHVEIFKVDRDLLGIEDEAFENDGCTASLGAMPSPVIDVVEPSEPREQDELTEAAQLLRLQELVHVPIPCLTVEEHILLKALCNEPKLQKKIPLVSMKIAELEPTQWRLDQSNVRRLRKAKQYNGALVLGRRRGKYIRDGHHRTEAAKLDGVESARHRFLDMGNTPMTLQKLANRLGVDKQEIINAMDSDDRVRFEKQP